MRFSRPSSLMRIIMKLIRVVLRGDVRRERAGGGVAAGIEGREASGEAAMGRG